MALAAFSMALATLSMAGEASLQRDLMAYGVSHCASAPIRKLRCVGRAGAPRSGRANAPRIAQGPEGAGEEGAVRGRGEGWGEPGGVGKGESFSAPSRLLVGAEPSRAGSRDVPRPGSGVPATPDLASLLETSRNFGVTFLSLFFMSRSRADELFRCASPRASPRRPRPRRLRGGSPARPEKDGLRASRPHFFDGMQMRREETETEQSVESRNLRSEMPTGCPHEGQRQPAFDPVPTAHGLPVSPLTSPHVHARSVAWDR